MILILKTRLLDSALEIIQPFTLINSFYRMCEILKGWSHFITKMFGMCM